MALYFLNIALLADMYTKFAVLSLSISLKKLLYISLISTLAVFTSCRKDKLITSSSAKLNFSKDSILFDTVFTSIGSTTKLFRVHNNNSGAVNISSIKLARGSASFFRLNVDGLSGKSFTDVEIPAHDSIYIFVEVTIDPTFDPSLSPFIYRDSILFETNGNAQDVDLIAFGQNAYYHMPNKKILLSSTQALYYEIEPCNTTWLADKPHLVYGYAVIDSACNLTIQAGAKIYLHNNGGIWVYRYGSIQVNGTQTSPVTFQGDRLEAEYKDLPGQWDRIWINEGSANNIINYAIIKNGFIGVHVGYTLLDGFDLPYLNNTIGNEARKLNLSNTIIQNCSFAGLLAHNYTVTGGNDLISNCGKYLGVFQYGGSYSLKQSTFANYWSQTNNGGGSQTRTTPSFFFNNYAGTTVLAFDSLFFGNCIMDGNLTEEFQFDTLAGGFNSQAKFKFDYCIMKTQLYPITTQHLSNQPPSFINAGAYDFHLGTNSAAGNTGSGIYSSQWPMDIEGNFRSLPDLGAYKK